MNNITVHQDNLPIYDIVFNDNFDSLLVSLNKQAISNKKLCIVTETNVADYYLDTLTNLIKDNCLLLTSFIFKEGESSKNLDTVQELYEHLIINRFDRNDILIALGGGVVGDLCGYTAATYLRGIDFIQVPTSLLSQVDSSVGGKTGVDFSSYKNMVGAFHMPKLVYMNISVLDTISDRQFISGMGEVIKYGVTFDKDFFNWIDNNFDNILEKNHTSLAYIISKSCDWKRQIVEEDPTEKGVRGLLNFGHTLGHAIEKYMNFSLLHGECVAIGSILSTIISYHKGLISKEDMDYIIKLYTRFKYPILPKDIDIPTIIEYTKNDKKMQAGIIKFILLKNIGEAYIDTTVTEADMTKAFTDYFAIYK